MDNEHPTMTRAIVTRHPNNAELNWNLENVTVPTIQDDEILVRIVASGICHTDIGFSTRTDSLGIFPRILGHEGAGYVTRVGKRVTAANVGDMVLLSFASCATCESCAESHPAYCSQMPVLNYLSEPDVFHGKSGEGYNGKYFGQSSFAGMTACKESSIINVTGLINDEELKLFAPLGCGLQTGAGAITNVLQAGNKDIIAIVGLGGVGLAAVMAAKIKECPIIIGVDRFQDRLDLAKSLGATHIINTSTEVDLIDAVRAISNGRRPSYTIDTTGNMTVIKQCIEFTALRGQIVFIGVPPPDAELNSHMQTLIQSGKSLRGCIIGDADPKMYIPQMIQWYREGNFPITKLVTYYPVEDWKQALNDMRNGITIKPVLTF